MDFFAPLVRNIFYPMWMIRDGDRGILQYLNYFHYIDKLSQEALEERQFKRLRRMLIHAYENTAYYKKIFTDTGFNPHDMNKSHEINALPILTKDIIRANYKDITAININKEEITEANTGGSTGVPMQFLRDKKCIHLRKGQELYFDRWMGYKIGDKVAVFVAASHFEGTISRLKAKVRNASCERMLCFDPSRITDDYMANFSNEFKKFKPSMIKCFPNSLTAFANFITKKDIDLPSVRSISCTGENLYQHQRQLFESTFGGEVFEKVGTRESGVFACECEKHDGLHVFTEGVFLEIIDSDGRPTKPGEIGRVVVTDLFNRAMPLIRYSIGDMATPSYKRSCECGCPLPLIEKLLGRDRDIIIDSQGNPKPGYLFTEVVLHMNLSAQFQIIQPDREFLLVKIVQSDADGLDISKLISEFQKIVGPLVKINCEFVTEIPRDPSGKYGYVISKLKH